MRGPTPAAPRGDLPSPVPPHPADALLTPERAHKYRQVLARRTARLAVVVEDCYDPHNATAIVRTCDAFGIHRVLVTTGRNPFKVSRRISQGSHYYVDVQVCADIGEAYARLRADGFAIYVSDLAANAAVGPDALAPILEDQPLAVVFGSEGEGVSKAASAQADGCFLIPMSGFPQSLNLSVSVAATVYTLRRHALTNDLPGDLPAAEQCTLYDRWLRRHKGEAVDMVIRQTRGRDGDELDVMGVVAGVPGPQSP